MYHTLHEARCDRCKRTYSSSTHPSIEGWKDVLLENIGGNEYPYDPDRFNLCGPCGKLMREFMENFSVPETPEECRARSWDGTGIGGAFCTRPKGHTGAHAEEEPLAAWERELLAKPEDQTGAAAAILDTLADVLYPMDGFRDDQWNGGDVCEAVADLLHRYRPDARLRQPERPEPEEEGHKHEWRWSNKIPGFTADGITRRYCIGCGVLFSDL